ncbi:MAG: peptidoglycan DD-metalloendopeptidase family protein [Bacteroidales bacterium]|nr:peptidoglycan DD-metalloendopeptidase family protein [Bacteroidales bacterium]
MKKILGVVVFIFFTVNAFSQYVDITDYSQNIALRDTLVLNPTEDNQRVNTYPTISEVYQIPCYDLYDKYWDVRNLRSRMLEIPFADDRLMLILVQSDNAPFTIPCVSDEITLRYGMTKKGIFHPGVDLKVTPQSLVKSCFDGVVRMAAQYGDYGLLVVVRHYNGLETVYAHLDKVCVKPGQMVKAGDVIGQTGRSGHANDDILHFEVRFMNECLNPEQVIDFEYENLIKNTLVLQSADFNVLPLDQCGPKVTPINKPPKAVVPKPEPIPVPKPVKPVEVPASVDQPMDNAVKEESAAPVSVPSAPDREEAEYYVVKKGEGLYRIALNHKTTVDKLMKLNNISNPDQIQEGQKLRVR